LVVQSGSEHNQESTFYVTYLVTDASWHASYDVRVQSDQSSVQIIYYGIINQRTGEAWRNMHVSLSTANPSMRSQPPVMNGITLGYKPVFRDYNKSKKKVAIMPSFSMRQSDSMNQRLVGMPSSASNSAPAPMQVQTAQAEQGATSASYTIPRICTIPSDGNDHKVTIGVIKLDNCVFQYYWDHLQMWK
jgi:uncharacterized protein (TIGR02231 family)